MAAVKESGIEPYHFDPAFERAVVFLCCTRSRFFGRIGHALEADALSTEPAKLAIQAAQSLASDLGHGPEAGVLVIQRLRQWMGDGRVTLEQVVSVNDLLDQASDEGVPPEDSVVITLMPTLQQRIRHDAVRAAIDDWAKKGDFSRVEEIITQANRIGAADTSVGTRLGKASFDAMEQIRNVDRLPTGISELDYELDGGLWRGAEGIVVGGTGDGKSMFLSHVSCEAALAGLHVLYATLELPPALVLSRVKANLTGIPINLLMNGSMGQARTKIEKLATKLGPLIVKDFTPHASTVEDVRDWLKRCEDENGRAVDLLVIDYADKLTAKTTERAGSGSSDYVSMRVVYESLRVLAVEKNLWCWTASQKRRQSEKAKKKADTDDVADSLHKSRVADLVITLNSRGEHGEEILYFIAKNRIGRSAVTVGPFPHDFALGRMVSVNR